MDSMSDRDVWKFIEAEDLWIYDKLILAKRLGHICGPAGVAPPYPGEYVIKPCVNFRMMGKGAYIDTLSRDNYESVPDGYFWVEKFTGRHLSFDYCWGDLVLAVEGFKDDPKRLDRFSRWQKVNDKFTLPSVLQDVAKKYNWLNVEVIGGKVIEAHLRYNDDFKNHNGHTIIPIWKEEFYESAAGDRLGFIVKSNGT